MDALTFSPLLFNAPAAATLLALWPDDAVDDREETDFLAVAVLVELIGAVDDDDDEADEALCGALRTSAPDGEAAEGDDFTLSADLARATIEEGGEEDFSTGGAARVSASGDA